MGACGSSDFERKKEFKKSSREIKNELIISPDNFYTLDESITKASKSLCKIIVSPNKMSSGFLIQLFKGEKKFYCLITNEHVITN